MNQVMQRHRQAQAAQIGEEEEEASKEKALKKVEDICNITRQLMGEAFFSSISEVPSLFSDELLEGLQKELGEQASLKKEEEKTLEQMRKLSFLPLSHSEISSMPTTQGNIQIHDSVKELPEVEKYNIANKDYHHSKVRAISKTQEVEGLYATHMASMEVETRKLEDALGKATLGAQASYKLMLEATRSCMEECRKANGARETLMKGAKEYLAREDMKEFAKDFSKARTTQRDLENARQKVLDLNQVAVMSVANILEKAEIPIISPFGESEHDGASEEQKQKLKELIDEAKAKAKDEAEDEKQKNEEKKRKRRRTNGEGEGEGDRDREGEGEGESTT